MKPTFLTPRDMRVVASATRYSIVCGKLRRELPTEALARSAAEQASAADISGRGAMLYAIGTDCGIETSVLMATYTRSGGWSPLPRRPPRNDPSHRASAGGPRHGYPQGCG